MRLFLFLLALATILGLLIPQQALATSPTPDDMAGWKQITRPRWANDIKLFNSFPLHRAQRFGKDIVVDVNGFKVVDVDNRRLVPLLIPGATSIYSVCDDSYGRLYALCQADKEVLLKIKVGGVWSEVELPVRITERPRDWVLVADGGDVAVGLNAACHIWHDKKWTDIAIKNGFLFASEAHRNVMRAGKIYCAFNHGEWGGRLTQIDTTTGDAKIIGGGNISEEKIAPDGSLWWVLGCNHLGLQTAGLMSYDGVKMQRYCEVVGMRPVDFAKPSPRADVFNICDKWPLRPTSFHGLEFRKDGAILVGSSDYGILRYKDGKWDQVTKDWKEDVLLCGLEVTDSDVAVLPVYELGIALYDLKSGKYSFILPDYCTGK